MSDTARTVAYVVAAAVLAALAILTVRGRPDIAEFTEEGTPFFPDFEEPTLASSIEIVTYSGETAAIHFFKVERRDGRWLIPSHQDYPAEAEDRLAKTAAGIIALKRGPLRSDRKEDHETLGVVDPTDEGAGLKGRGTRVTLRDDTSRVLADFIMGDEVRGREGFRFLRLPDRKRTYVAKVDVELTGAFRDWIEPGLLKMDRWKVSRVEVDHYRVEERKGEILPGEVVVVSRDAKTNEWGLDGQTGKEEFEQAKWDELLLALSDLEIVGVVRKPKVVNPDLSFQRNVRIRELDMADLQSKGFFAARVKDWYRLVSNEGELRIWTEKGVRYVLSFGELASGGGGREEERRYLFLTVSFDETFLPEPAEEAKKEEWKANVEEGRKTAKELQDRFADWYYIIPGDVFKKAKLHRGDLVHPKEEEGKPPEGGEHDGHKHGEEPGPPVPPEKKAPPEPDGSGEPGPPVPPEEKKDEPKKTP
ncbi:MAG: DUF4340 domain-containing protein [Planctomycetota bacterium]|jgi:hypothetical protein